MGGSLPPSGYARGPTKKLELFYENFPVWLCLVAVRPVCRLRITVGEGRLDSAVSRSGLASRRGYDIQRTGAKVFRSRSPSDLRVQSRRSRAGFPGSGAP